MDPRTVAVLRGWADADELEPITVPSIDDDRRPPWRFSRLIEVPGSIDPASVPRPTSRLPATLHLVVLLGVGNQRSLVGAVRRRVSPDPDQEPQGPSVGDCCSATVAVDVSTGRPIPTSLVVSHLVMLARRLRASGVDLGRALQARHADIDDEIRWLVRTAEQVTDTEELWAALLERWWTIAASFGALGGSERLIGEWTRPNQDPEAIALGSFFAPALRALVRAGHVNETLARYLANAPGTEPPGAVDVGRPEAQRDRLRPGTGPIGRWPLRPEADLTTSQRVAVVRMSERLTGTSDIVAINGPPGTGKSTLLREFVAQQVVRRAAGIVELGPTARSR